jgi:putative transposase
MTAGPSIDPELFLHEQLAQASPDLLREMLTTFINTLLSAQADTVCGGYYGTRSPERTNRRNGYRHRDLDTRVGTLDVAIPKLREGSYFPDWLLQRRRRAEAALTSVVATCYLLGVSTRRMDKLVQSLGITGPVQVPGVADGQGPRRAGRAVPHQRAHGRPTHVRRRRRPDDPRP